jgi:hypothetical protein
VATHCQQGAGSQPFRCCQDLNSAAEHCTLEAFGGNSRFFEALHNHLVTMADAGRLSTIALVASTAAISCALTGLATAYVLSQYSQQQQHYQQQEKEQQRLLPKHVQREVMLSAAHNAAVDARASCSTPEPTLPGVDDHQHEQLQQYQQQQQHNHQLHQLHQQPQQQQQQRQGSCDVALFSPINPQKRPDPYDVRPRHT